MISADGQTVVDQATRCFAAYCGGDRRAFDDLVTLLTPLLWHTVRAQGVHHSAAEDVVQTTWLRLLHSSSTIRDSRTVVKWLLTTARREAWRVRDRARTDMVRQASLTDRDGDRAVDLPAPREQAPEERLVDADQQQRLWAHVSALPERCRELLRVIAFADRPDYAGIAGALGMPVGSIGPTRGRCLAKLRHELAADPRWDSRDTQEGTTS